MILYGSDSWALTKKHESHIQATEMRFLRVVKGCTRQDRFRNFDIREELQIYSRIDKIKKTVCMGRIYRENGPTLVTSTTYRKKRYWKTKGV